MKVLNFLTAFSVLSLAACGGGGGGGGSSSSSSGSTSSQSVDTKNIIAERDFLFQIERKIHLDLLQSANDKGVVHVYSKMDSRLDDGRYIADPTSHITSIYPQDSPSTDLIVNVNWSALYIQWTPMGQGEELTWRVELDPEQSNYLLQF